MGKRSATKTSATSPQKIALADRQLMALTLRRQGGSYRKIADQLRTQPGIPPKYNERSAHNDVMAVLNSMHSHMAENADAVRYLELERVDEMFASIWPYAKQGDYQAIERVLKLMDKRAQLMGLTGTGTSQPRGAGMASVVGEVTGGLLSVKEVIIQLTGVDMTTSHETIDVTPHTTPNAIEGANDIANAKPGQAAE